MLCPHLSVPSFAVSFPHPLSMSSASGGSRGGVEREALDFELRYCLGFRTWCLEFGTYDLGFLHGWNKNMKNKRIVITGGAGFIGSNLAEEVSAPKQGINIHDPSPGTK